MLYEVITGYMARAAFIMDNIMHRFGLHGRSFIPMIMGFGCNVPAIMATRSMRNKGDRIFRITSYNVCYTKLLRDTWPTLTTRL